jgi:hypothetical protein
VLSEVLGDSNVSFYPLYPTGYKKGEFHVVFCAGILSYSSQRTETITGNRNISHMGVFNAIPIYAYE